MDNIKWITLDNGVHIPIRPGEDKEEAVKEFFAGKYEDELKEVKQEDIRYLENLVSDGKSHISSPRWRFDEKERTAFKDLGNYMEDSFNDLKNEEDWTITHWLTEHGFKYKLYKGSYDWQTKGKTGRNWVNTDKGNKKTAKDKILLEIYW